MTIVLSILAGFAAGFVWSSIFEWTLHKYVMHRPFLGLRYSFKAHALTHHRVFDWDETYHIQREEDEPLVTFAWWNAPALIGFNVPIMGGVSALVCGWMTGAFWGATAGAVGAMSCYYFLYEYLHWCMHVPGERWFSKMAWFRWIDDHHRMHHKKPTRNLNVVMPFADFLFRTRAPGLSSVTRQLEEVQAR